MPDTNDPAVMEARRRAMDIARRGGRSSTVLTTAMAPLAAGGSAKLGG
jgi:hypothetical protein